MAFNQDVMLFVFFNFVLFVLFVVKPFVFFVVDRRRIPFPAADLRVRFHRV